MCLKLVRHKKGEPAAERGSDKRPSYTWSVRCILLRYEDEPAAPKIGLNSQYKCSTRLSVVQQQPSLAEAFGWGGGSLPNHTSSVTAAGCLLVSLQGS